ncbi:hypothetical protein ATZ33_03315 [Enterococcus silesiacus]|uniref:Uncharacterized protein n=1 Tax=Enterococcus silesiacus TaxID=332949 RepID=A0A0S3K866_9ENTE|nr:hypothetical protein [Enterococcus silesiacus]ALS00434.1 hypothetical protein ATZ33_03315 [Enterococcus silesiacus]OJG90197.1 hypothetical protein RV15_GL001461 [Enterococcus silesiacus]
MVLEALDRIREAEADVERMRQTVKTELSLYEQKKAEKFKQKQVASQEKITVLLQELETQKNAELQKEKDILLSEAKEQNQDFREKYEKNKASIIDYVIERVKKIYGSQ